MPIHTATATDGVSRIAFEHGFFPETIWNHADNRELRRARDDMNLLVEGDEVFVPALTVERRGSAAGQRHKFRRKGVPEILKVQLMAEGKPRAEVPFRIEVDGKLSRGKTDSEGFVRAVITPSARTARLFIDEHEQPEVHELMLGGMQPVERIEGVQERLNNLGYDCGVADGVLGAATRAAIAAFARDQELVDVSLEGDEIDDAVLQRLRERHDRDEAGDVR